MNINKTFWEVISQSFYDIQVKEFWHQEIEFDLEEELNPEEKLKIRMKEALSGIMSCSDLELMWFQQEKAQQKEKKMRATFIKRRIMVALAMVLVPITGFFTAKAMESYFGQPTFICQPAEVRLGHQMIWNVADTYCSGHITDAAVSIMKDNNIEGKDLRDLLPSTIIVIKGGN
jgi:hypothetical protein